MGFNSGFKGLSDTDISNKYSRKPYSYENVTRRYKMNVSISGCRQNLILQKVW